MLIYISIDILKLVKICKDAGMVHVFCFFTQLLDENDQLVRCITEYMQKGRAVECVQ